jgi:hypothetical protein
MISKKLLGRTDIDEHSYSAKDMFNFLPASMGGAFSRPGSVTQIFVNQDSAVIPWERSDGNYFIIFKQKTFSYSDFCFEVYDPNWVQLINTQGFYEGFFDGGGQLINRDGSATGLPSHKSLISYQTNTNVVFETLSLDGFQFITYNNCLILAHNSGTMPPLVFSVPEEGYLRIEHYQFSGQISTEGLNDFGQYYTHNEVAFGFNSTPYDINKGNVHLLPNISVPSGQEGQFTTGYVTGTLTAYVSISGATTNYFDDSMHWTFVILNQGNKEGIYFITSVSTPSVANVTCIAYGLDNTTRSRNFRRQLFAPDLGFPKIVSTFNNRLCFANTATKPSWFFASRTNNFREIIGFRPFQFLTQFPLTEVDSFEFPLTSKAFSEVRWISHQNDVLMGSSSGEFSLTSGDGVLSALNISINPESNIGSSIVPAVKNSEAIFFISSDGKSIRKAQYNFDVRGYRSQNISILNDDIIYKIRPNQTVDSLASIKIIKIVWQESNRVLWVLTNTNNLFSVTIEPTSNTTAWAYHVIGNNDAVKDIFSFQSRSLERSVLGLVVERSEGHFIDFMAPDYLNDSLEVDSLDIGDQPVFMDGCHLISIPTTTSTLYTTIANFSSGILIPNDSGFIYSPEEWLGFSQRFPTGKKFVLSSVGTPDANLYNGAFVYLINKNQGYGFPLFYVATSLANALAGTAYMPSAPSTMILTDAEPTATYLKWGSFTYLANKTVDVIADGILREDLTVDANGVVTLPVAASKISIGYRFEAQLEPVTPDIGGQFGSSQGSMKRIDRAYVRYYKTRTGKIGSRAGNLEPIVFPETPFTGAIEHYIDSSADREYSIILKKEQSLPMNIMSVTLRGKTDE